MENLQVYRVRFDTGTPLISKLDQQRVTTQEANSVPLSPIQPAAPQ
jgi:soluble lytic murein transglycosylase